jgi:hypothetical protein
MTVEALARLGESDSIFTLLSPQQIEQLPGDLASKCVSLLDYYQSDRNRRQNYRAVAEAILAGSRATRGPIAYLTLGSPRVLDSVSQLLIDESPQDTEVRSFCAVSSFDSVLSDIGYDPAGGVQVVEANQLVLYKTSLTPSLACLIFQPGVFGTDKPRLSNRSPVPILDDLRDHLLSVWRPDHPVASVFSYYERDGSPRIIWTTLGELGNVSSEFVRGTTLFVPGVLVSQVDEAFAARILDSEFG